MFPIPTATHINLRGVQRRAEACTDGTLRLVRRFAADPVLREDPWYGPWTGILSHLFLSPQSEDDTVYPQLEHDDGSTWQIPDFTISIVVIRRHTQNRPHSRDQTRFHLGSGRKESPYAANRTPGRCRTFGHSKA